MSARCAIRGSFFDFVDDPWKHPGHEDRAARYVGDGLLVVRDGIVEDFGNFAELSLRHADLPVTHLDGRLILPGFIDGHIHFPQLRGLGVFGDQLLTGCVPGSSPRNSNTRTAPTPAPALGTSSTPCRLSSRWSGRPWLSANGIYPTTKQKNSCMS